MFIDRILAPIETLGPGKRLVIWTKGCSKRCKNCANPELWTTEGSKEYSVDQIFNIVTGIYKEYSIEGITISGGDPLEQKAEFLSLIQKLSSICKDTLVYTGYRYEDLCEIWNEEEMDLLCRNVGVLIDGPYIEELNDNKVMLRGSTNQKLIIIDNSLASLYEEYCSKGRKIQNVYMGEKLISVGIHNRKEV